MNRNEPTPLEISRGDGEYLIGVAELVLGGSSVAATNAKRLIQYGFDTKRIEALLPSTSAAVALNNYVFKKIQADPESPGEFGLLIRRLS